MISDLYVSHHHNFRSLRARSPNPSCYQLRFFGKISDGPFSQVTGIFGFSSKRTIVFFWWVFTSSFVILIFSLHWFESNVDIASQTSLLRDHSWFLLMACCFLGFQLLLFLLLQGQSDLMFFYLSLTVFVSSS